MKIKEEFNPIRSVLEGKELKGTAKITITNTKTGKSKTTVEKNIVTNAVKDLFASNLSGLANFQEILPVRNLFSGCLMFEEEITASASSYLPPAESTNRMIACAGDEAHNTRDPYRGNPDGSQTVFTENSATFTWHWTEGQGNGDIGAICLCPGILGNVGLKPYNRDIHPFKSYNIQVLDSGWANAWTKEHAIAHPISINAADNTTKSLFVDDNGYLHIITASHDLSKYGICRSVKDFDVLSEDVVYLQPRDGDNFGNHRFRVYETSTFYGVVIATNTDLGVYKVSKSNHSVDYYRFVGTGPYQPEDHFLFRSCPQWPANDTSFFWPVPSGQNFKKYNWVNTGGAQIETILTRSKVYRMSPMKINNNLILGENYMYNSGTFYPLNMPDVPLGGFNASTTAISTCTSKSVVALFGNNSGTQQFYGIGTTNMFLSTINTLDVVRTKTSTDIMKLEYEIAEV